MLRQLGLVLFGLIATLALQAPVQAEVIAYWRFEGEGDAFLADSSGNGHTLTNNGGVAQSSDVCDGTGTATAADGSASAQFDGTDDSFQASLDLRDYRHLRISWWQKCANPALGQYGLVYEHSANFNGAAGAIASFHTNVDGSLVQYVGVKSSVNHLVDRFERSEPVWEYVVVEYNLDAATQSDIVRVWHNGTEASVDHLLSSAPTAFRNDTFFLGARGNSTMWLDGTIDEFKIENVPEPGSLSLLCAAGAGVICTLRWRWRCAV